MTELTDFSSAFAYGDSLLAGDRVRLRGVREDDLPTLAKAEMDAGILVTLADRVVPPSGNLWIAGQQVWLGPAMTGRTVRLHAGLDRVHVLLDGYRVKTLEEFGDTLRMALDEVGPSIIDVPIDYSHNIDLAAHLHDDQFE